MEVPEYKLKVEYKGKVYKIDLRKELAISESVINSQLKSHPTNYGFLLMLRSNYTSLRRNYEKRKDDIKAKLVVKYSQELNEFTGKPYNREYIESKVRSNINYNKYYSKFIKYENKLEDINSAIKAYETRERLLQTISSNMRKETF